MTDHAQKAAEEITIRIQNDILTILTLAGVEVRKTSSEPLAFVAPIISRAIADSERELVEALRAIMCVLGPGECRAVTCQGCQHEHAEAVAIARALLAKRGRK